MKSHEKWDYSLYPDVTAPDIDNASELDKADYLDRFCRQADFGFFPSLEQIEALAEWRNIFEKYPVPGSAMYYRLKERFGWAGTETIACPSYSKLPWQIEDELDGRQTVITV
jgi:hypothetical protein